MFPSSKSRASMQAGSFYDITEGTTEGLESCEALRSQIEEEEKRLITEDQEFRSAPGPGTSYLKPQPPVLKPRS